MVEFIPAILTDSIDDLRAKLGVAEKFAKTVHIDICDGTYVPTHTVQFDELRDLKTPLKIEFHLMVNNPGSILNHYLSFPAERVLVHADSESDVRSTLRSFAAERNRLGLAFDEADFSLPDWLDQWDDIDDLVGSVTFVTVKPGKQHQKLLPDVLKEAQLFRAESLFLPMEIDGGVHQGTIEEVLAVRPDRIVLGSELWEDLDPAAVYAHYVQRKDSQPDSH